MPRIFAWVFFVVPCLAAAGTPQVAVCYGYHCNHTKTVTLKQPQWNRIRALFAQPAGGAEVERRRIARAIALFERFVGEATGTSADLKGNFLGSTMPGQQDCIDESTNTTTYLDVLQQAGLLHWHFPEDRVRRAPRVFDVHWSAVIRDRTDNDLYAVDSWFLDNGRQPYVQPLRAWLKRAPLPFNPDAVD